MGPRLQSTATGRAGGLMKALREGQRPQGGVLLSVATPSLWHRTTASVENGPVPSPPLMMGSCCPMEHHRLACRLSPGRQSLGESTGRAGGLRKELGQLRRALARSRVTNALRPTGTAEWTGPGSSAVTAKSPVVSGTRTAIC